MNDYLLILSVYLVSFCGLIQLRDLWSMRTTTFTKKNLTPSLSKEEGKGRDSVLSGSDENGIFTLKICLKFIS